MYNYCTYTLLPKQCRETTHIWDISHPIPAVGGTNYIVSCISYGFWVPFIDFLFSSLISFIFFSHSFYFLLSLILNHLLFPGGGQPALSVQNISVPTDLMLTRMAEFSTVTASHNMIFFGSDHPWVVNSRLLTYRLHPRRRSSSRACSLRTNNLSHKSLDSMHKRTIENAQKIKKKALQANNPDPNFPSHTPSSAFFEPPRTQTPQYYRRRRRLSKSRRLRLRSIKNFTTLDHRTHETAQKPHELLYNLYI